MNLSKFFIDRPIFAGVLSLLIFIVGPDRAALPADLGVPGGGAALGGGARQVSRARTRKVIAETVATPLEEPINGVEDMLYMGSQATTDGLMTLTVTFKLGTEPDIAQQQVQNRVTQAEPRLPEEVRRLGVTTVKSAPDLTMVVHLVSPNDRYDMTYLRNYAVLNVKDQLARIEGVGQVQLFGSGDYSMRVWLDPQQGRRARTDRRRRGARHPRSRTCRSRPAWWAARPAPTKIDLQLSINAQGRLQSEEEFGDIIVKSGASGAVTRLRDVARIELGASEYALRSLLDNKPAVAMPIFQAPGSNAIEISDDVRAHDGRAEAVHARGRGLRDRLRPDPVRARLDRGGGADAARGDRAGRAGRDPVPADLARLDHSAGRGAGVDRRHVRGDVRCSASRSTRSPCSAWCSPSASWSTTRSWWWRTSSATSRPGLSPRDATYRAMREVTGPIIAIALVLVAVFVPHGVHQRPDRAVLQAVRAHHRDLDGDLGDQLADALARACRAAAQGHDAPKDG